MYELAEQKGNYFCNINDVGDTITLAGFHLTLLEPLRRWRINFNGMLRYYSNSIFVKYHTLSMNELQSIFRTDGV